MTDLLAVAGLPKTTCKGLIFRVRESRFMSLSGAITSKREYRPLKRLSCAGCPQCEWIEGDLRELDFQFVNGGKDGDTVQLKMTNIGRDPETGYIDDYDLEFVKIKPDSGSGEHG